MKKNNHIEQYFSQVKAISDQIDNKKINDMAVMILNIKKRKGRIFLL